MSVVNRRFFYFSIIVLFISAAVSCDKKTGNILFTANGEEFIVSGLVSKDGWDIQFENVLVNISSPEAYNPGQPELKTVLEGHHLVDLKKGTSNKPEVTIGITANVEKGNYQSLKFSLKQMESGEYAGYSIVLKGSAKKDNINIPFLIKLDEELTFDGREGYVGDHIKGILQPGKTTDVEMTFHFDHIFGNSDAGDESHVNSESPGFEFFLSYMKDNKIDVNQEMTKSNRQYEKLILGIETLGHLGEGHCEIIR